MKILIGSLIAGLLLSLSLSAKADTTTLKCTLADGENLETRSVEVSNPAMTSIEMEAGGVTFTASAIYDVINVYAKMGEVTIGNSGRENASLDIFRTRGEALGFSCKLIVQTDHWCNEI